MFFVRVAELSESDRLLVHSIESVVIDWTHQISKVLKRNSAQALIEGLNPGPIVELNFWKSRSINLENIFLQVNFQSFFIFLFPHFN